LNIAAFDTTRRLTSGASDAVQAHSTAVSPWGRRLVAEFNVDTVRIKAYIWIGARLEPDTRGSV